MRRGLAWWTAGVWGWAAAVAAADRLRTRSLDDVEPLAGGPLVSVVVPARDEEAAIGRTIEALERQSYADLEVVVLDDESGDGTRETAQARAGQRVRVLAGEPLPAGWVGKSWACHQGARAARGDWLLFTDADVVHAPESVARGVALAQRLGGGGITALCRLDTESPSERIVQPAAAALIRAFVTPGPLVRSRRAPTALAIGGFILVRRDVYDRAGGHAAVRDRLVDDKALAEHLKAAGHQLHVVDGTGFARVRMYDGVRELWRGWRKNASVGVAESSPALAAVAAVVLAVHAVAPVAALARGPRGLGAGAVTAQLAARLAIEPVVPTPPAYRLTLPLGCLFLAAVSLASTLDRLRGGVVWRGRRYP